MYKRREFLIKKRLRKIIYHYIINDYSLKLNYVSLNLIPHEILLNINILDTRMKLKILN